jgi:hypothetical protein
LLHLPAKVRTEEEAMHDLDRAMFELGSETEMAGESEVFGEIAGEVFGNELLGEVLGETSFEAATALEAQETELAAEMLEITNEAELDRFLGKLISSAGGAARNFARSPAGQQLGGILKSAAKQALPVVGGAIGGALGGGTGETWGSRIGAAAGNIFGLELEGLSNEDTELEVAKGFVRFAKAATCNAVAAPPSAPPAAVARTAAVAAARHHAPGLLPRLAAAQSGARSGRWVRKGDSIVIYGV